jgi:hypothetical protein
MLDLKEVTLNDRDWVSGLMRAGNFRGSEFTFPTSLTGQKATRC